MHSLVFHDLQSEVQDILKETNLHQKLLELEKLDAEYKAKENVDIDQYVEGLMSAWLYNAHLLKHHLHPFHVLVELSLRRSLYKMILDLFRWLLRKHMRNGF